MGRFSGTADQSAPGAKTPYFIQGEHLVQVTKFFVADSQRSKRDYYMCFEGRYIDGVALNPNEAVPVGTVASHIINSKHGEELILGMTKGVAIALGADVDKLSDPDEADAYLDALTDVGVGGLADEFQVDGEGVLVRINVFQKDGKNYFTHVYSEATEEDYELLMAAE